MATKRRSASPWAGPSPRAATSGKGPDTWVGSTAPRRTARPGRRPEAVAGAAPASAGRLADPSAGKRGKAARNIARVLNRRRPWRRVSGRAKRVPWLRRSPGPSVTARAHPALRRVPLCGTAPQPGLPVSAPAARTVLLGQRRVGIGARPAHHGRDFGAQGSAGRDLGEAALESDAAGRGAELRAMGFVGRQSRVDQLMGQHRGHQDGVARWSRAGSPGDPPADSRPPACGSSAPGRPRRPGP